MSKYDKGYIENSDDTSVGYQIIPEQAFEDSRRAIAIEGPWLDFPSFAAWVEACSESFRRRIERGKFTNVTPQTTKEGRYYVQQDIADGRRAEGDLERFLAAASPLGVSHGAILEELQTRRMLEQAPVQLNDDVVQRLGADILSLAGVSKPVVQESV